jgi:hypothetical protein
MTAPGNRIAFYFLQASATHVGATAEIRGAEMWSLLRNNNPEVLFVCKVFHFYRARFSTLSHSLSEMAYGMLIESV